MMRKLLQSSSILGIWRSWLAPPQPAGVQPRDFETPDDVVTLAERAMGEATPNGLDRQRLERPWARGSGTQERTTTNEAPWTEYAPTPARRYVTSRRGPMGAEHWVVIDLKSGEPLANEYVHATNARRAARRLNAQAAG